MELSPKDFLKFACEYPEVSPWNNPSLARLIDWDTERCDNPKNPFDFPEDLDEEFIPECQNYQEPAPIPRVCPADIGSIRIVRVLWRKQGAMMLRVEIGEHTRILKLYNDIVPNSGHPGAAESCIQAWTAFRNELSAYAHLQHYGAIDEGVVQRCYGWTEVSIRDMENGASFGLSDTSWYLATQPVKAIILEDFPRGSRKLPDWLNDEKQLSVRWAHVEKALKVLYRVHASYVRHNGLSELYKFLVSKDGRISLTNFSKATSPGRALPPELSALCPDGYTPPVVDQFDTFTRLNVIQEMRDTWFEAVRPSLSES